MAIFTNGFEEGDFSGWTSESESGAGVTNAVAANFVHHGSWSYEIQGLNAANEWGIVQKTLALTYDELYMRAYVRFNDLPASNGFCLVGPTFRCAGPLNLCQPGVFKDAGGRKWMFRLFTGGSEVNYYAGDYEAINSDQWYCLESYVLRDNVNGLGKLWVDEVLKVDAAGLTMGLADISTACLEGYISANEASPCVFIQDCAEVSESYIGPEVAGGPTVKKGSNLSATMTTMLNSKMLFSACNRFPKLSPRHF